MEGKEKVQAVLEYRIKAYSREVAGQPAAAILSEEKRFWGTGRGLFPPVRGKLEEGIGLGGGVGGSHGEILTQSGARCKLLGRRATSAYESLLFEAVANG